jgi:hypothetical protein
MVESRQERKIDAAESPNLADLAKAGGKMLSVSQVRRARGVLGWSQQELAKRSGVALPTFSLNLTSRHRRPRSSLARNPLKIAVTTRACHRPGTAIMAVSSALVG